MTKKPSRKKFELRPVSDSRYVMRERPSSRLLIIDPLDRILLFKFEHTRGPLEGQRFWATPGGGLDPGESYEQAARRELLEETGLW